MPDKKIRPFLPKEGSEAPHKLWIPLQNFKFNHHTFKNNVDNINFIGRVKLIKKIGTLLKSTIGKRGSYLVAGYRGSGKTSLINHVLNIYEEESPKKIEVIRININLGHDGVLDTRGSYLIAT